MGAWTPGGTGAILGLVDLAVAGRGGSLSSHRRSLRRHPDGAVLPASHGRQSEIRRPNGPGNRIARHGQAILTHHLFPGRAEWTSASPAGHRRWPEDVKAQDIVVFNTEAVAAVRGRSSPPAPAPTGRPRPWPQRACVGEGRGLRGAAHRGRGQRRVDHRRLRRGGGAHDAAGHPPLLPPRGNLGRQAGAQDRPAPVQAGEGLGSRPRPPMAGNACRAAAPWRRRLRRRRRPRPAPATKPAAPPAKKAARPAKKPAARRRSAGPRRRRRPKKQQREDAGRPQAIRRPRLCSMAVGQRQPLGRCRGRISRSASRPRCGWS